MKGGPRPSTRPRRHPLRRSLLCLPLRRRRPLPRRVLPRSRVRLTSCSFSASSGHSCLRPCMSQRGSGSWGRCGKHSLRLREKGTTSLGDRRIYCELNQEQRPFLPSGLRDDAERAVLLGQMWNALSDAERAEYEVKGSHAPASAPACTSPATRSAAATSAASVAPTATYAASLIKPFVGSQPMGEHSGAAAVDAGAGAAAGGRCNSSTQFARAAAGVRCNGSARFRDTRLTGSGLLCMRVAYLPFKTHGPHVQEPRRPSRLVTARVVPGVRGDLSTLEVLRYRTVAWGVRRWGVTLLLCPRVPTTRIFLYNNYSSI